MIAEQVMTTEQVAKRFYLLATEGKWSEILDELFSSDASSIEPSNSMGGLATVSGLKAIREKGKAWDQMIQEVHGGYCNEPQAAGDYFVCTMGIDVTMKGQPRRKTDEVALYHVQDGKIVSEQFFY